MVQRPLHSGSQPSLIIDKKIYHQKSLEFVGMRSHLCNQLTYVSNIAPTTSHENPISKTMRDPENLFDYERKEHSNSLIEQRHEDQRT